MSSGLNERPYLSIGEVLGLLLEEFPDVTISKIRFLESQGLIEPERTSSGYRKFFDPDIDRLRVILREQRENFLPLRVIRDRLETGEIDDSGPIAMQFVAPDTPPRGIRNVVVPAAVVPAPVAASAVAARPGSAAPTAVVPVVATEAAAPVAAVEPDGPEVVDVVAPKREFFDGAELCEATGITLAQLADLESFGLVVARVSAGTASYSAGDVDIAIAAAGFMSRGIDARHLRSYRQAAEREIGLYEQRIMPLLRQRNPHARVEANTLLGDLVDLGGVLRSALVASLARHHLEP